MSEPDVLNDFAGPIKHRSDDGLWHDTQTCYEGDVVAAPGKPRIVVRKTRCGIGLTFKDVEKGQTGPGYTPKKVERSTETTTCFGCLAAG